MLNRRERDWMFASSFTLLIALLFVRGSVGADRSVRYSEICRRGPGLVSHPFRCDAFIECTSIGRPIERLCGPSLLFNADKRACDHRHLVTCALSNNEVPSNENEETPDEAESSNDQSQQFYHETVYGQQQSPTSEYNQAVRPITGDYNPATTSSYAAEIQKYCYEAMLKAKKLIEKLIMDEKFAPSQTPDLSPYRSVSNFFHAQPYAKTLTYSALTTASAVNLIQQRFEMSGSEVMKVLNKHGINKRMLKPLPGIHHSDTELPLVPGFDFCPYPTNVVCQRNSSFRTLDGSCNNPKDPLIGRAMTPYRRLMPAKYADGVSTVRQSANGKSLPGARTVSDKLFTDVDKTASSHTTMALVFFAQFIDHDLTRTAAYKLPAKEPGGKMQDVTCGKDSCESTNDTLDPCLPILVADDDFDFAKNRCLKFVRSMPVPLLNCQLGPREQLNQVTHWLDGSQVYGSSKKESDAIRDFSQSDRGRMIISEVADVNVKPLLPKDDEADVCHGKNSTVYCFKAGDGRVNENPGITSYHTIFVRQHNLLEEGLHHFNPSWSGERLFQETRRIVTAILQHVTYNELLPLVLGKDIMDDYELTLQTVGYYDGYDDTLDGRVTNEFVTAAFRFGHTLLQERLLRVSEHGKVNSNLWLSQTFNSPVHMHDRKGDGGVDSFIRGLSREMSQSFDWFFTKQITRSLFTANPPTGVGHDLTSINIQRGRDHGLPTYNDVREWCNIGRARSFEDLSSEIDYDFLRELQRVYSEVNDIDLFVGGVSENPSRGAVVGPTFACLIASTFQNVRRGDRYWHENKEAGFSTDQLQEIRKVMLARILCVNSDSITKIHPHVFLEPATVSRDDADTSQFNAPVDCDSLPDINLSLWAEN